MCGCDARGGGPQLEHALEVGSEPVSKAGTPVRVEGASPSCSDHAALRLRARAAWKRADAEPTLRLRLQHKNKTECSAGAARSVRDREVVGAIPTTPIQGPVVTTGERRLRTAQIRVRFPAGPFEGS